VFYTGRHELVSRQVRCVSRTWPILFITENPFLITERPFSSNLKSAAPFSSFEVGDNCPKAGAGCNLGVLVCERE
jgi:hypothetical protein